MSGWVRAAQQGVAERMPRTVRLGDAISFRFSARPLIVTLVLVLVILVITVLTLTLGRLGIALADLPAALAGEVTGKTRYVLGVQRGPRVLVAIGAGFAFGVSGAIFQRVTRNPLGSPDVIGLTAGASAGAVAFGLVLPGILPLSVGALLGALLAMGLVFFATGTGFRAPGRMIIAGIGVSAIAMAFVQFALTRTRRESATVMAAWLNGSLEAKGWDDVVIIATAVVIFGIAALLLGRRLSLVELGDDVSDGLGSRATTTRGLVVFVAIGLSAIAVSVCGPVAFIALTAPHLARGLTKRSGLLTAGLMGSVLLVAADLVVQQAPLPQKLPVGIVTAGLGAIFLAYLLIMQWRKGSL